MKALSDQAGSGKPDIRGQRWKGPAVGGIRESLHSWAKPKICTNCTEPSAREEGSYVTQKPELWNNLVK